METRRSNSKSAAPSSLVRNRKPLSELNTNTSFNLIPISTLRKLCSFSDESNPNLSQTSVGSSNAPIPKTLGNNSSPPPSRLPLPSSRPKPIDLGDCDDELVVFSQKNNAKNSKRENVAGSVLSNSTPLRRIRDKGKAIDVPVTNAPPVKETDKEERKKDKEERTSYSGFPSRFSLSSSRASTAPNPGSVGISTPSPTPSQTPVNPGDCDDELVVLSRKNTAKNSNREKVDVSVLSDLTPLGRIRDKGKAIDVPFTTPPPVNELVVFSRRNTAKNSKREKVDVSVPPLGSIRDKGKAIDVSFTTPPPLKEKDKEEAKKDKAVSQREEHPYKRKSAASSSGCPSPNGTLHIKRKSATVLSCPPLPRTVSKRKGKAGGIEPMKSWTHPIAVKGKKKCKYEETVPEYSLQRDFVEQQKAYFKEIDEFELQEEEVSNNELD